MQIPNKTVLIQNQKVPKNLDKFMEPAPYIVTTIV